LAFGVIYRICRRQLDRRAGRCPSCGASRSGRDGAMELVLQDGTEVPVVHELTIGRAPGNGLQLADPSVSRVHARVAPVQGGGALVVRDERSSYGTWVDGRRIESPASLRDGARVRLGDQELVVRRRRGNSEAGRTIVVPAGASIVVRQTPGQSSVSTADVRTASHPRLRSGHALKRLEAGEGTYRWVLKDLVGGGFARLDDADALLLQRMDGLHSIPDLVAEAERRLGAEGPARLALLLADLGARGLLAGESESATTEARRSALARVTTPRTWAWPGAGRLVERMYLRGGWVMFTLPALAALALVAASGMGAFAYLIAARYGTPFVVAHRLALGGLVFLVGRLAIAALHELGHGLTLASFGRRVGEVGMKFVLLFPYAYIDTSDAWFEPRRRRMAVSAAGPVSDLTLGGVFSLVCLTASKGTLRDVFFQLAFAAYVGALFNLNPLLERDGYHLLVDLLREPDLRPRALAQLRRRLAGRSLATDSRVLARYGSLVLAWTGVSIALAVLLSLRYERALSALVPGPAAWVVIAPIWAALLAVPLLIVVPPLRARRRGVGV
jgi:putative peptide zinc metalloprotease protein